jgi:hypothetical protein
MITTVMIKRMSMGVILTIKQLNKRSQSTNNNTLKTSKNQRHVLLLILGPPHLWVGSPTQWHWCLWMCFPSAPQLDTAAVLPARSSASRRLETAPSIQTGTTALWKQRNTVIMRPTNTHTGTQARTHTLIITINGKRVRWQFDWRLVGGNACCYNIWNAAWVFGCQTMHVK